MTVDPPVGGMYSGGWKEVKLIDFDLDEVQRLAEIQCTHAELASFFDCSEGTIDYRMKNDEDFKAAYAKGSAGGKASLRRVMWHSAIKGNVVLMIFLAKNFLGLMEPRDKVLLNDIERIKTELIELREKLDASPDKAA